MDAGMKPTNARSERHPEGYRVEALLNRIEELERERAEMDRFAATAAHEMLEPLIIIEGHAAVIGDTLRADGRAEAEQLKHLSHTASRLRGLLEMVLHDARSGSDVVRREHVELKMVVREVVALHEGRIRQQGVTVDVAELPAVTADSGLLGAVISNLVSNALKYSVSRGGHIEIRAERAHDQWRVVIGDDGPRLPQEERERIFLPYERGARHSRSRGAGLGLAVSKRIIERHGGTIGVVAGARGNDFFFTLPR